MTAEILQGDGWSFRVLRWYRSSHRPFTLRGVSILAMLCISAGAQAQTVAVVAQPPLELETSDIAKLGPPDAHRVILASILGSGGQVIDGDTGALRATLSMAALSNVAIAPDQRNYYVAESIWSKGNRGTRQDMISVYDGTTLTLKREIPLPGRAYMVPRRENFVLSPDGARAFIYNFDPSSSVIIVDLNRAKVEAIVETPGCGLVFPWMNAGFSSLCGDGSVASVALGVRPRTLVRTASFFDPEADPVFEQSPSDPDTGKTLFISYAGTVYPATLGLHTVLGVPWSLQGAAGLPAAGTGTDELAWRPGGRLPFAYHKASGRLYVLMHAGPHWTQRVPGTELWVIDAEKRLVIKRIALDSLVDSVAISQDASPVLYLIGQDETLRILSTDDYRELHSVQKIGTVLPVVPGA